MPYAPFGTLVAVIRDIRNELNFISIWYFSRSVALEGFGIFACVYNKIHYRVRGGR